ncbi:hypothetical protein [uncultured Sphingomonas sp.]|uniref:hypothetical protein n=1 Tax=uncultured Sphingomonas sp. TaxID=158754 RepID=UPI0025CF9F9B|nr:hypothetical protein [uncultured Sphingomonas sp.]
MKRIKSRWLLALVAGPVSFGAAQGAEAQPVAAGQAGAAPFGDATRMAATDLATITGREDTNMTIRASNTSNVSNNSVVGQSQTGTVSFDGQAFGNLSGLSVVSANTGNNVSINASMNLNVAIRP